MTTPSSFYSSGLSIAVSTPRVQEHSFIANYAKEVNSYSHVISAVGGFASANILMSGNEIFAEDWLQNGLGRHIVVYGPSMQVIWEGFVNELSVNMGAVSFSRGPLTNVGNRVTVWYVRLIEFPDGTVEPISGVTEPTIVNDNEDSQTRYGIWEKILNIGEAFPEDAEYIRDLYLAENSYPEGNPTITVSGDTGESSINLTCRGYYDWLGNYPYNDDGENQYVYCSELIKNILAADTNDIISSAYDRIDENVVLHATYTNEDKLAKTLIEDILTLGGGADDRWTFGIYENRKAHYSAIPTSIEYVYHSEGKMQEIQTVDSGIINSWDVRPCKWVAVPGFLSGFGYKNVDYRNDPRVFFAEQITFTAPDQVVISGAKVRKLSQYLAKLGLGGA